MTAMESHLRTIASEHGSRQRHIALFDLDRTLIAGYSILPMAIETARQRTTMGQAGQAARLLADAFRLQRNGGAHYHQLVKRLARVLAGVSEQTLYELGERAWQRSVARSLYPEAIALVAAHRAAGHHLVIVSAASRYQVEPVARALGIDEICCTGLAVENGKFTGEVIAPLCYGEGKVMAARRVARKQHTDLHHCWFYSDSSADLPLLRKVKYPVTVNASDKLAVHARNRDWPQLSFCSRGINDLEQLARTALVAQSLLATTALGAVSKKLGVDQNRNANRLTRLLGDVGSGLAGLDFEIEGAHHLEQHRPAIYVFNHQSLLDSMVLAHLLRGDVVALCKREMASKPVLGPLLRQVDTIFVDRDRADQSGVLKQALAKLQQGRSLCIAPEGTRSTLGNLQSFKHGAFLMAKKAGVPIVPIVLHNVKDALPKGSLLLRPARIRVTVLPPIPAEQIGRVRRAAEALEQSYAQVLEESDVAKMPRAVSA